MLVYRSAKKTNVELELLTGTIGQHTVRMFTIMFSSLGAADEFKKLFKQVRGSIHKIIYSSVIAVFMYIKS